MLATDSAGPVAGSILASPSRLSGAVAEVRDYWLSQGLTFKRSISHV